MKLSSKRALSLAVAGVLLLLAGVAAAADVPLVNWMAPPTWTPSSTAGGHMKFVDISGPLPFIPMTPCRVADTRTPVATYPAAMHPSSLAASTSQNWFITGKCGVPGGAAAVSANFTAVNTLGGGFLKVWPLGGSMPDVSTLNYGAGQTVANAAIVPLSTLGGMSVIAGVSGTDMIMDVNGYFAVTPVNQSNYFSVVENSSSFTIYAQNNSTTCSGACGMYAYVSSGSALWGFSVTGGEGVYGTNADSSAPGVHGVLTANVGGSSAVYGEHKSTGGGGIGVSGTHAGNGYGVLGRSDGATGANAKGGWFAAASTTNGAVGVEGAANGATGVIFGVYGHTNSSSDDSAGVKGVDGSGEPTIDSSYHINPAGVRGDSQAHNGVVGVSQYIGTGGVLINGTGIPIAQGLLGSSYGTASGGFLPPWGVFSDGNFGATGAKHFVEPHATDASMVVVYSSLEGREVGTYFRGTARASGGRAIIEIPEDFRMVTDEEGLTVQLTPVGGWAQIYVESQDLNQIVVQSSREVTFHYLVQGVRRAFRNFAPVGRGNVFMPQAADARIPAYLTEEAKRRLIQNGTYNADGTVNKSTAERVGWAEEWRQRAERAKAAPAPKVSTTQQGNE